MNPIPLPSHVHYELLLQLLERQTTLAGDRRPIIQEQVQQLIVTLRKALAQQKHLEELCERHQIPIEYRWSLNDPKSESSASKDFLSLSQE
jgi:hypothetical protein